MVFFTCSHCGESVKKPSVAKHYQTKCRKNEPFLTCVDCLKDFKGTEYEAHTKCVTEDERYSAKGFVPKPSQNKGERKQQAWQECIQTVLKKPTLKPDERELIGAISKFENVPRKKAKFINFLSNAFRQYSNKSNLIDRVWTQMESVFKETTGSNDEQKEKSQEQDTESIPTIETPKIEENGLKKEKKRKRHAEEENPVDASDPGNTEEKTKKKKQKSNEEKASELTNDMLVTDETESKHKKKHKKRKADENGPAVANDSVLDETEPGKKKKKKKHDKHTESQINETIPDDKHETESKTKKKSKKRKSENVEEQADAETEPPNVEIEGAASKKKKKEKKSDNKENCGEKTVVKEETPGDEEKPNSKKKKSKGENGVEEDKQETFDWKATILKVLSQDSKNKRIQLQKLQKKVVKLHCQILNCENSEKKDKKFMKKLKEMPEIEIENDFVVLKS